MECSGPLHGSHDLRCFQMAEFGSAQHRVKAGTCAPRRYPSPWELAGV